MDQNNREPEPMETNDSISSQDQENMEEARGRRQNKKTKKSKDKVFLKQTIRASGATFLEVFQNLLIETHATGEDVFLYMQRVYHSIFFFGHINDPQVKPEEFVPAREWKYIEKVFEKPLAEYKTHVPSQTPYSILLEYITKIYHGERESVLKELEKRNQEFLVKFYDDEKNQLRPEHFALSAAVICHSCVNDPDCVNTYGSSIAYKGKVPRRIMIAISTLLVWDKVISYEVRCGESGHGIQFPNDVCCYSYKFDTTTLTYEPTSPCTKCKKMYLVNFVPKFEKTCKQEDWRYGNCAETESLSNLLHYNENIRRTVHTYDDNEEIVSRETIINRFTNEHRDKLQKEVKNLLESSKFKVIQNVLVLFTPAELSFYQQN
ncbi:uncharacterized protein [Aquarana catesbeiana]|uniref:uncharacterized protein n=1 Tax=Aquarana catesbeiana TaxID=8400 RepID=UPI003CC96BDD